MTPFLKKFFISYSTALSSFSSSTIFVKSNVSFNEGSVILGEDSKSQMVLMNAVAHFARSRALVSELKHA